MITECFICTAGKIVKTNYMSENVNHVNLFSLRVHGRLLSLQEPVIMGIINCTPDSFYGGSRYLDVEAATRKAVDMVSAGAAIIDLGGQSTRPGSKLISADEEVSRVLPVLKSLKSKFPEAFISIDTFYASVAAASIAAGAAMVNDVSGGHYDSNMLKTVAELDVPFICMHMKGTPQTMQQHVNYDDFLVDIIDYFNERIRSCEAIGITDLVLDPGFGFSKTIDQSFYLLKNLSVFSKLGRPLLAGLSRKSAIYKTLDVTVEQSLNGTSVLNTLALLNGANILRVHDVLEAGQVVKLVTKMRGVKI